MSIPIIKFFYFQFGWCSFFMTFHWQFPHIKLMAKKMWKTVLQPISSFFYIFSFFFCAIWIFVLWHNSNIRNTFSKNILIRANIEVAAYGFLSRMHVCVYVNECECVSVIVGVLAAPKVLPILMTTIFVGLCFSKFLSFSKMRSFSLVWGRLSDGFVCVDV